MEVLKALKRTLGEPKDALARRRRMDQNLAYAFSHFDEWRRLYPDQWIAVHGERLLVAPSRTQLISAIEHAGIPIEETFVRLLNAEKRARFL